MDSTDFDSGPDPPAARTRLVYSETPAVAEFVETTASTVGEGRDSTAVACVLSRTQPEQWETAWNETVAWTPASLSVAQLVGGDHGQAVSDGSGTERETASSLARQEHTLRHDDLPGIGRFVLDTVADWRAGSAGEGELLLCFDSLDSFLQHHSRKDVFEFFHLVGRKVEVEGGRMLCFLDANTVDPATRLVFESVFDEVIEPSTEPQASD